jgi:hypothetical protein
VSLRVLVCAVFAVLASAAPAQAQLETPPTVINFINGQTRAGAGEVLSTDCGDRGVAGGGWDGGAHMVLGCPFTFLSFTQPQAMVEFFVRMQAGETWVFRACAGQQCSIASQQVVGTGAWTPVVLADPGGNATIQQVVRETLSSGGPLELDDVAFSPVRQPGTAISGSTQFAAGAPATFELFSSGVSPTYSCAIDGAAAAPCSNPYTATGLAGGVHTLTVTSIDAYGAADPSPAQVTFNVAASDADGDGRPDASDNCPAVANSDQADGDADGVGNACEQLPAGNVPPVAGVNTVVRQIAGEVFVKLPAGRSRLGFRGMISAFQETGFLPLKGVASVPIGSTVDTRKGEIGIESALNSYAPSDRRSKRQTARVKTALFTIKQRARRRGAARKSSIPMDFSLLSPPRAEAACVRGPAKGVVRSMSMTVKGYFRALGGASTATARNATFNTTDRCDGTLTEVGKGRVSLKVKGKRKPVVVRAGRAYLVKAKLFQVRKGRTPKKGSSDPGN